MNKEEDSNSEETVLPEIELNKFRDRWKAELLLKQPVHQPQGQSKLGRKPSPKPDEIHEKAKEIFMNGVWCEQNGLIYEALEHYRRATKMVPDIDIKMAQHYRQTHQTAVRSRQDEEDESQEVEEVDDLCTHFRELCSHDKLTYCAPAEMQKATHISQLPGEVLAYILQWVVSTDIDVRSLEQFSMVCRGFYLLARDPHLWQLICSSIWGVSCQTYHPYSSWRSMCIHRPHLYFNGVYMNKVELMRQGEATLDKFYPPWMKVVYFRYLRFFPDGLVFMHTSPQDPTSTVAQLRSRKAAIEGMCQGMYRVQDENKIVCMLNRVKRKETRTGYKRHRRKNEVEPAESETTFLLELSLQSSVARPNSILHWEKYSINVYYPDTQGESSTDIELTKADFPDMKFARVKSYTSEAGAPLTAQD